MIRALKKNGKRKMIKIALSLLLGSLLFSSVEMVQAANLGVEGSVYVIAEPDMLTGIHRKLAALQESGELERQQQQVVRRSIAHIMRPQPVSDVIDLPKGRFPRSYPFDPSIVLNKDIKNTNGDVIAYRGERVNPLDRMNFNEILIFINGDNPSQVDWANRQLQGQHTKHKRIKIILVKGDIKATSERMKHQVYFDQHGSLCRYFHITHTPTQVFQPENEKTKELLVQEVRVD